MNAILDKGLSYLGDILMRVFTAISGFFLQFFPDADQNIISTIHGWSGMLSGYDLTFNIFYFIDMGIVGLFMSMSVVVLLALVVYVFVKTAIETIHKLVEMIPIVE